MFDKIKDVDLDCHKVLSKNMEVIKDLDDETFEFFNKYNWNSKLFTFLSKT